MSFISACCNTMPVKGNYTPIGTTHTDAQMTYYVVGDKGAPRGIVFAYDIFGLHPNAYQVADLLSQTGLRVIIPDLLEGKPLTPADLGNPEVFAEFRNNRGTWEHNKDKFRAAVRVLNSEGTKSVGTIGLCWGAKLSMVALADEANGFKSAALVHPSLLTNEDFVAAKGPILLLPTKDEADFSEGFAAVKAGPHGADSYEERLMDMFHGFCGARGDFSDPEIAKNVNRVISLSAAFFKKTLA
ncbi:hypothetical protein FB645_000456 [Coemansia sp. IMI 203386]|nr:hypothetical protein FB645_000456 [Coemansia sp. IMI 203386]